MLKIFRATSSSVRAMLAGSRGRATRHSIAYSIMWPVRAPGARAIAAILIRLSTMRSHGAFNKLNNTHLAVGKRAMRRRYALCDTLSHQYANWIDGRNCAFARAHSPDNFITYSTVNKHTRGDLSAPVATMCKLSDAELVRSTHSDRI